MTKKVIISPKPSLEKRALILDQWVAGKETATSIENQEKEIRFTVVLPEHIYYGLKMDTVKKKVKLKDLVISIIAEYLNSSKDA